MVSLCKEVSQGSASPYGADDPMYRSITEAAGEQSTFGVSMLFYTVLVIGRRDIREWVAGRIGVG